MFRVLSVHQFYNSRLFWIFLCIVCVCFHLIVGLLVDPNGFFGKRVIIDLEIKSSILMTVGSPANS